MNKNEKNPIKLPPQDVELERVVLGTLLLESKSFERIADILRPETFYFESHKTIYESIVELNKENFPVDLLTIRNNIAKKGKIDQVGGFSYLTQLTDSVSSSSNLEIHARILVEKQLKRDLILLSYEIQKDSFEGKKDAIELLAELESYLASTSKNISSGKTFKVSDIFHDNIERIQKAGLRMDGITGINSGYGEINRITNGWQNSDLIIVAARPAMGKTDLAINIARNTALENKKVAFFSLEMSKEQLFDRFLAVDLEIEREKIKSGQLSDSDWVKVANAKKTTQNNFIIQDEPSLNVIQFKAICRRLKNKEKIDMIILDYLQLMSSDLKGSTNDKVSDISRNLKLIAKELNIPVIALSQLSRSVETRGGDKKPMLSDLRDSGAIEQDADIVIFPYRPIYYGITEDEEGKDTTQMMKIDFAKNRSGKTDTINLRYLGKFGKVVNWNESKDNFENDSEKAYRTSSFKNSGSSHFEAPF